MKHQTKKRNHKYALYHVSCVVSVLELAPRVLCFCADAVAERKVDHHAIHTDTSTRVTPHTHNARTPPRYRANILIVSTRARQEQTKLKQRLPCVASGDGGEWRQEQTERAHRWLGVYRHARSPRCGPGSATIVSRASCLGRCHPWWGACLGAFKPSAPSGTCLYAPGGTSL